MNQVFPIMRSHQAGFKILTREQKGLLMEALLAEFFGEDEMPELDPVTNAVFAMMQRTITDHIQAQEKRRNACRENGKLGGRPKKNLDEPKKPIGFSENLKNLQVSRFQEKERSKEKENSGRIQEENITPLPLRGDPQGGSARPKKEKKPYGEFGKVLLTDEEYSKLCEHFGGAVNAGKWIDRLDGHLASKGDPYKSHYATILNWERRDKERHTASTVPRQGYLSEAERRQMHNDEVCRRVSAELEAMDSPF